MIPASWRNDTWIFFIYKVGLAGYPYVQWKELIEQFAMSYETYLETEFCAIADGIWRIAFLTVPLLTSSLRNTTQTETN